MAATTQCLLSPSSESLAEGDLIIERMREGDVEAWRLALAACGNRLHAMAAAKLPAEISSRVDASDVVQGTLADVCASFDGFCGRTLRDLYVWTAAILKHNVHDEVRQHLVARRRTVRVEGRIDGAAQAELGWDELLAADDTSPSTAASREERRQRLLKSLEVLPPRQRLAVHQRHLEGRPLSAIAQDLDCSVAAAAAIIARGLRSLRHSLQAIERGP